MILIVFSDETQNNVRMTFKTKNKKCQRRQSSASVAGTGGPWFEPRAQHSFFLEKKNLN